MIKMQKIQQYQQAVSEKLERMREKQIEYRMKINLMKTKISYENENEEKYQLRNENIYEGKALKYASKKLTRQCPRMCVRCGLSRSITVKTFREKVFK